MRVTLARFAHAREAQGGLDLDVVLGFARAVEAWRLTPNDAAAEQLVRERSAAFRAGTFAPRAPTWPMNSRFP